MPLNRLLLAGLLSIMPLMAYGAEEPPLKNGVGLHGPLTWGRTDTKRTQYLQPVYGGPKYALPADLLKQTKEAGFDFIRLTIDPGPLLALEGSARDELDNYILDAVKRIRAQQLDVLVDFHPISMLPAYSPSQLESASRNELFDNYVAMVKRYAKLLAALDVSHIAIEPMNEPQLGYDNATINRWQSMMKRLYDAVRSESNDMVVVVTGGRGGSIEGLLNMDPSPFNSHVRYSFHYYLPYIFTMQGNEAPNLRIRGYTYGLPYPAKPEDFDNFWATVEERVNNAPKLTPKEKLVILHEGREKLEAYFKAANRDSISADFNRVSEWAQKNKIRPDQIFLGEFGVTQNGNTFKGASTEDRSRWLSDVREEAEKRGFHWAMWTLTGDSASGMTLTSVSNPRKLDVATLEALGKAPTPKRD